MDFGNISKNQLLANFYIWSTFVCIILFGIFVFKLIKLKHTSSRFFLAIVLLLITYYISDIFWALGFFNIIPNSDTLIRISRLICYSAVDFIAYYWLLYVDVILNYEIAKKKKKIAAIPLVISLIITFIVTIFFSTTEHSIRGLLSAIAIIFIPFCFVVFVEFRTINKAIKETTRHTKYKFLALSIWPFLIATFSILQIILSKWPVFCFGGIIVVSTYFINDLDSRVSTDPLTNLNNRNMLNIILDSIANKNEYYSIFMIDIDKFKNINDTYGHIEGDNALVLVSGVLNNIAKTYGYFLARYGGDEFIMIAKYNESINEDQIIDDINSQINEINRHLDYNISISAGYSHLNGTDNISDKINDADKMLYKNKSRNEKTSSK